MLGDGRPSLHTWSILMVLRNIQKLLEPWGMNTKKKKKKRKVSIPGPAGRIEIPAQISREHIDFAVRAHDITSELEKRTPRF